MTFCGQCGTEIAEKDGFCTNCGRKAAAKKEQQTEQSVNNWTDLYQSTKKLSKKKPRKKAAKKGVQTRRKYTAANLQSDLNDIKFWQGTIRDVLQGIQEELDELLDKNQATDDEHLPLEYLKKHLEKSSFKMFHKYDTVKKI